LTSNAAADAMRIFISIAFIVISLPAAAGPVRLADGSVSQDTVDQVRRFLEKFIDANKTAAEYADFFADGAEFYDRGVVGKTEIVRDVERYTRRWPWRFYRLTDIEYITPDPASNRVFVSYEIEFEVANPSKTVAGRAHYGAVIADPEGAPRIEWIKERVAGSKRFDTLED
jgi:hypothetical protein